MAGGVLRSGASFLSSTLIVAALAAPADAQTSTVLANFEIKPKHPAGELVQVQDGIFYGVSSEGGRFEKGSVYVLYRALDGSWDTYTLHSFNGADGARPKQGLLLAQDGNFYGTTTEGGSGGAGTVFRITPFGSLTTLHAFRILNGAAHRPAAPLTQSADGYIWGTTCPGSLQPSETSAVFRMTTAGAFTSIYRSPLNNICLSSLAHADNGQLIGLGTRAILGSPILDVFRLTRAGQFSQMRSYIGAAPARPIFRGSGNAFYVLIEEGFNQEGIPSNSGRAIGLTAEGATLLDVRIPSRPETLVEVSPGVLFGTSSHSFFESDTYFFRIQSDGEFSVVKEWARGEDVSGTIGSPRISLVRGLDGLLYGLSSSGGPAHFGMAFAIDLAGNPTALSTLSSGPLVPLGALVEDGGALYGTSCVGGSFSFGTVFRLEGGAVTILHSFGPGSGACPTSLLKGPDGHFYGNTLTGTIFRITAAGSLTVLHTLDLYSITLRFPDALTRDAAGNLWGNWRDAAGAFVYRVTPAGPFTRFSAPPDVGESGPAVTFGVDGNLYGAFDSQSSDLFRMTPAGDFTTLYRFPSLEFAKGPLASGSDSALYGTAAAYHRDSGGHVFRVTLDGQRSTLHTFGIADLACAYHLHRFGKRYFQYLYIFLFMLHAPTFVQLHGRIVGGHEKMEYFRDRTG
jgi:uncharacterized repeat protein (TIGR03803 family)